MEISIGIRNVQRELTLDVDLTSEEVSEKVSAALENNTVLSLTDTEMTEIGRASCRERV